MIMDLDFQIDNFQRFVLYIFIHRMAASIFPDDYTNQRPQVQGGGQDILTTPLT